LLSSAIYLYSCAYFTTSSSPEHRKGTQFIFYYLEIHFLVIHLMMTYYGQDITQVLQEMKKHTKTRSLFFEVKRGMRNRLILCGLQGQQPFRRHGQIKFLKRTSLTHMKCSCSRKGHFTIQRRQLPLPAFCKRKYILTRNIK